MARCLVIVGGVFVLLLFIASLFSKQMGIPELPIISWKDITTFMVFVFVIVLVVRGNNRG